MWTRQRVSTTPGYINLVNFAEHSMLCGRGGKSSHQSPTSLLLKSLGHIFSSSCLYWPSLDVHRTGEGQINLLGEETNVIGGSEGPWN